MSDYVSPILYLDAGTVAVLSSQTNWDAQNELDYFPMH